MRRLPNLGSMGAEALVAAASLVRFVTEMPLAFVGLIPFWESGAGCPLVTRRHTQLERCGAEVLSLDDFFGAVYRTNRHLWRSLAFLAEFLNVPGAGGTKNLL
eukprot:2785521-Rhodomonas_salina.1